MAAHLSLALIFLACGWGEQTAPTPTSPEEWAEKLNAAESPVEQLVMLEGLLEEHAGISTRLCPRLNDPATRVRCESVQSRPHLFLRPRPSAEGGEDASAARRQLRLPRPASCPHPLAAIPATPCPGCLTSFDVIEAARVTAQTGGAAAAAGLCHSIDSPRWRQECMFLSAEDHLSRRPLSAEAYADAVGLCAEAGDFLADCLLHLHAQTDVLPLNPAAPQIDDWLPLIAFAEPVRAHWVSWDPAYADRAVAQIWSTWLMKVFFRPIPPAAGALRFLPEAAHPHLRAALALRLAREGALRGLSLDDALARLDAALTAQHSADAHARAGVAPWRLASTWITPEDAQRHPTLPHLQTGQRLHSPDPAIDRVIVLLEAAARADEPERGLLREARAHADPLVRMTAEGLLVWVEERPSPPPRGKRGRQQVGAQRR